MTNTAFSTWKHRIAPVFDVSRSIRIVEIDGGQILHQTQAIVPDDQLHLKALRLAALKVDALVCGAISRSLQELIVAHGIDVIPFVAGDLHDVIRAWVCGELTNSGGYTMPGCRRIYESRRQEGHVNKKEEHQMFGKKRGKRNAGQGQGSGEQGRQRLNGKGKGQNQRAGRQAAGMGSTTSTTEGFCVCPQCGLRIPHASGARCVHQQCPQCGAIMSRQ